MSSADKSAITFSIIAFSTDSAFIRGPLPIVLLQKAAQNMVEEKQLNSPEQAADIVVIGSGVGRHISPFSAVYGANYGDALVQQFNDKWGLLIQSSDVANAVHFIVAQPAHVHISDIMIRPTKQDYP